MYYQFRLKAGVDLQANIGGKVILVDSTGAADGVTITPMRGGSALRELPDRQKAFKCVVDFDTVVLRAPVDCTVGLFLSATDVSLGFTDTARLTVSGDVRVTNDSDNPVAVEMVNALITASDVTLKNDDASAVPVRRMPLKTLQNLAPVVVGLEAVAVVADPALQGVRFRNADATARIALGGAGVSLNSAVLVLEPGDVWAEEEAGAAAWYAVADKAGATLAVMGVKA
jgi:hypothetical protein